MNKRVQTLGLHSWSENDLILNFYVTKFGTNNIWLKSLSDLSKYIGTTECSFTKQSMNFRYLMGCKNNTLSDYSKLQRLVFELFNDISQYEFFLIVSDVIDNTNKERERLLKLMGKTPERMKLVRSERLVEI